MNDPPDLLRIFFLLVLSNLVFQQWWEVKVEFRQGSHILLRQQVCNEGFLKLTIQWMKQELSKNSEISYSLCEGIFQPGWVYVISHFPNAWMMCIGY